MGFYYFTDDESALLNIQEIILISKCLAHNFKFEKMLFSKTCQ